MTGTDIQTEDAGPGDMLATLRAECSDTLFVTGADTAPWASDWMGHYQYTPLAVLRPSCTEDVSAILRLAMQRGVPVVPVSGNTGLAGGAVAEGALMLSLDRMNRIHQIRKDTRVAIVEAGVILSHLHDAADEAGMMFPMTFGARGSAMIGGMLSTNAGGSNVLRYGNTRDLCLGLEVVLPDGEVMDLLTELHKDNSGYNLKHLFIGAEGTLGVITKAVLKLSPRPRAYATALIAMRDLGDGLSLLNRLQETTGGAVEACEYMPRQHLEAYAQHFPDAHLPFDRIHEVNLLIEVGAIAPQDAEPDQDGALPVVTTLETALGEMFEDGAVVDAVVAQNDTQRAQIWAIREAAAELNRAGPPAIDHDIAVPLQSVPVFLTRMQGELQTLGITQDPTFVCHLGDGNLHYAVHPGSDDPDLRHRITETVEAVVLDLGGSFSAEHGIGLSKKPSMARRKNAAALSVMRAIKAALDPKGIMNPGKVIPD